MKIGLDIGSTTIKCVVLDEFENIIYKKYERHYSMINSHLVNILKTVETLLDGKDPLIAVSGSAGMGISRELGLDFIQEVFATKLAAEKLIPSTDVIIELGGEDAKILFLSGMPEVRMNGSCAGGTGAFIDQMATLLDVSTKDINLMAQASSRVYPIASRCGVFAKSDIQPLLNQGANKNDIALSIFHSVKNQTISGLAQGRKIKGNILYLGGPLTFFDQLRKVFDESLNIKGTFPENSLYYVALGAAFNAKCTAPIGSIIKSCELNSKPGDFLHHSPLFKDKETYKKFKQRHSKNSIKYALYEGNCKKAFLGIDAGSTTLKFAVINENAEIIHSDYIIGSGKPIEKVKSFLDSLYKNYKGIQIVSCAVTGYGEELIKNAFNVDFGIVETMAHFIAAKKLLPDVEFIIDIGGQDIKCFKIRNGAIENIFLNESCSSGCGSFVQTFANALGYTVSDFSSLGIFAKAPVELGSRCTVFMNSSVKQAQKDGASIEDISAGLSISVVKNAIYKVIRASSSDQLGSKIVVQGGTFLNDAVLRAFELELGHDVIRPNISGLMGAYGCAIYAMNKKNNGISGILGHKNIASFSHKVNNATCGICGNNCSLTINTFDNKRKFISGNKCQRPIKNKETDSSLNIYDYKLKLLSEYANAKGNLCTIGIPMVLNMYELLPFWYRFFTELGFGIKASPISEKNMYHLANDTIPSDTVCFPAKVAHGHIKHLIDSNVRTIFYPCMSYNFDEQLGDNNYNCPIVAYYPEVISANIEIPSDIKFINDYIGIHRKRDFPKKIRQILAKYIGDLSLDSINKAANLAYKEREIYLKKVRKRGLEIINKARQSNMEIIVLAGRPYHISPEINHGIDKLILSMGAAVISEDCISSLENKPVTNILNQWTYHSRLYSAAEYVSKYDDMNIIQLVSFGCGIDAITSDEIREILEASGKIYTQLKIDEITNPGAVKIRIKSLICAIEQAKEKLNATETTRK